MSETDLTLVDTQDLIAELARRHTSSLIVLHRHLNETQEDVLTDFRGGLTLCIGLAERAKHRLLQRALNPSEEEEE